jgi:hypothetical protein
MAIAIFNGQSTDNGLAICGDILGQTEPDVVTLNLQILDIIFPISIKFGSGRNLIGVNDDLLINLKPAFLAALGGTRTFAIS